MTQQTHLPTDLLRVTPRDAARALQKELERVLYAGFDAVTQPGAEPDAERLALALSVTCPKLAAAILIIEAARVGYVAKHKAWCPEPWGAPLQRAVEWTQILQIACAPDQSDGGDSAFADLRTAMCAPPTASNRRMTIAIVGHALAELRAALEAMDAEAATAAA